MEWLNNLLGGESSTALQLVLITVILVVALLLIFWIFRKIAGTGQIAGSRKRQPRLAVTDMAVVDDKRRLILVRRDNVEHLMMIGGPTDVVVESHVVRTQTAAAPAQAAEPIPDPLPEVSEAKPSEPVSRQEPRSEKQDTKPSAKVDTSLAKTVAGAAVASTAGAALAATSEQKETAKQPEMEVTAAGESVTEETITEETVVEETIVDVTESARESLKEVISETGPTIRDELDTRFEEIMGRDHSSSRSSIDQSLSRSLPREPAITPASSSAVETTGRHEPTLDRPAVEPVVEVTPEFDVPSSSSSRRSTDSLTSTEAPSVDSKPEDMEDEMQRLLRELSSEKA